MKPRIVLVIMTHDSYSKSEIKAPHVTDAMYDAAWDLIYTMSTGKRRKPLPRYKKYREQNEREAAARKLKKRTKLTKRTPGTGNADGTGIHAMVEGNRGDHQT